MCMRTYYKYIRTVYVNIVYMQPIPHSGQAFTYLFVFIPTQTAHPLHHALSCRHLNHPSTTPSSHDSTRQVHYSTTHYGTLAVCKHVYTYGIYILRRKLSLVTLVRCM